MNQPDHIHDLFQRRVGNKIIQTGVQSTSIRGNPDHPDHQEKWVWIDFDDLSRITIKIALLEEGPTVLGFADSLDDRPPH
jgi:hypothetical protein